LYWSRLLKSAEKNYSPTEKEALALKDALVKFQPIIEGESITTITDHSALTWSKTYQGVNQRLMTWGLTFATYPKLKIVHRAGRIHPNVDPISRLRRRIPFFNQPASNDPSVDLSQERDINFYGRMRRKFKTRATALFLAIHPPTPLEINIPLPNNVASMALSYHTAGRVETHLHIGPEEIKVLQDEYIDDPYFFDILTELSKTNTHKNFHLSSDKLILFQDSSGRYCLCIPKSMTTGIIGETHNAIMGTAHAGYERTYAHITNSFYWPKMTRDIHTYVTTCPICQQIKHA